MKWKQPEYHETRIRKKFLFFPMTVGRETRWLEKAYWEDQALTTIGGTYRFFPHRWLTFTEYYNIENHKGESYAS